MNKEEFKKLKEEEWYNPTIIFSVRDKELIKKDDRYKFHIFNHVSLHFPFNGEIVEASKNICTIKEISADRYMDFNGIKVILPLFIRPSNNENGNNFRYDKEMPDEYYNCADFVRKYLVKAGILKVEKIRPSVDELYFELMENGLVPSAKILNEIYFEEKEVRDKPQVIFDLKVSNQDEPKVL